MKGTKQQIVAKHIVNLTQEIINIYDDSGEILELRPRGDMISWLCRDKQRDTIFVVDHNGIKVARDTDRDEDDLVVASAPSKGRGGISIRQLFNLNGEVVQIRAI